MIGNATTGKVVAALMLALALIHVAPAWAARSNAVRSARAVATVVTDADSFQPGHALNVALELQLAPGWHSYWHDPGDAGAPPVFTLSVQAGSVPAGDMQWPVPRRIADGPTMSFGYFGTVLLNRAVVPAAVAGPLVLTGHAEWLVCQQICVPESGDFRLSLPLGAPRPSADAAAFAARVLPVASPWAAHIAPDGALWLAGVSAVGGPVAFLPDASDTTVLSAAQPVRRQGDLLVIQLTPTARFAPHSAMAGLLELGGRGFAVVAQPGVLPGALPGAGFPWATAGFALLSGVLLNLMPCVFPVLAMKALGLARLGGAERRQVRLHALSYTGGVLVMFGAVAALVLGLRQAGAAAGWGFQFQYPAFVAAMGWLCFSVGLALLGTARLPGSVTGFGQSAAGRGGHLGSFATGGLAVLVATPCTAPFMGAAVGVAMAAPAATAVLLFLLLGLGFALPYLLLAAAPGLAGRLPRPGRWMEVLKQALAFPMFATAVWLAWVVVREIGPPGVLAIGAGFLLIALCWWAWHLAGSARSAWRGVALASVLATLALLPGIARAPTAQNVAAAGVQPYSPARLASLRAAGQPVLVNLTASWCITCLVNERVALRPALPDLAARNIAYLEGDWSRADPGITALLQQYGRAGVPLYLFFPAGGPAQVLPQILSPAVLRALR